MKISGIALLGFLVMAGLAELAPCLAHQAPPAPTGAPKSEEEWVSHIKRLSGFDATDAPEEQRLALRTAARQQTIAAVDIFLARHPKASFKSEAIIIKLAAVAELARIHPGYLQQLLSMTEKVSRRHPTGRLESENAYYAIQGFVLGARQEKMPQERRLQGTQERYESFLDSHPTSSRIEVIRTSLIRNLIAQNLLDRAREEFAKLAQAYPNARGTRRAQGELYRAVAVGKPFAFGYQTPHGKKIRTSDFAGKVLVVHFWATWSEPAMEQLAELIDLHNKYEGRGLRLVGINIDKDGSKIEKALGTHRMLWPQYFDHKGFENDVLVTNGVLKVPTYFVVDRKGILRSTDPGLKLDELVKTLLSESTARP